MKKKQKKVLIALGFDESPERVLERSLQTAELLRAKVYVIHVIVEMPRLDFYFETYKLWEDFRDNAITESMTILKRYVAKYSDEYPGIECIVEVGEPAEKIMVKADELDVDLIVMGHHVRRGLSHMLHLNTCECVVRQSKRDVLTIHVDE